MTVVMEVPNLSARSLTVFLISGNARKLKLWVARLFKCRGCCLYVFRGFLFMEILTSGVINTTAFPQNILKKVS